MHVTEGELAFRAESVREFDISRDLKPNMMRLDCKVVDIEKILDRRILTLSYGSNQLLWTTKAKGQVNQNQYLCLKNYPRGYQIKTFPWLNWFQDIAIFCIKDWGPMKK